MAEIKYDIPPKHPEIGLGDFFYDNTEPGAVYIVTQIHEYTIEAKESFVAVCLVDGIRWTDPQKTMKAAVSGLTFLCKSGNAILTLKQ